MIGEDLRALQLEELSYQPQLLLQRTKELFEREEFLNDVQKILRTVFARDSDFKSPFIQTDSTWTEKKLSHFMWILDVVFFSGILLSRPHADPKVKLEVRDNIFNQIDNLREGDTSIWGNISNCVDYGNPSALRLKIEVDATYPHRVEGRIVKRDLMDMLETLIHEMAHAYFMLFACQWQTCEREMGATGHGPVWQELKRTMYMTVRQWDPCLRDLYADDWDHLD